VSPEELEKLEPDNTQEESFEIEIYPEGEADAI
jgi:hypothetical protein